MKFNFAFIIVDLQSIHKRIVNPVMQLSSFYSSSWWTDVLLFVAKITAECTKFRYKNIKKYV